MGEEAENTMISTNHDVAFCDDMDIETKQRACKGNNCLQHEC